MSEMREEWRPIEARRVLGAAIFWCMEEGLTDRDIIHQVAEILGRAGPRETLLGGLMEGPLPHDAKPEGVAHDRS